MGKYKRQRGWSYLEASSGNKKGGANPWELRLTTKTRILIYSSNHEWDMQVLPSLYIASSRLGGKGVFTAASIDKGSLIEVSPVLVLPRKERQLIDETRLHDYYFIWGKNDRKCAIVLGYGSLYNHAYSPNAQYKPDFEGDTLDFYALRDIDPGEEITVNYSGDPDGKRAVWFEVKADK